MKRQPSQNQALCWPMSREQDRRWVNHRPRHQDQRAFGRFLHLLPDSRFDTKEVSVTG